MLGIIAKIDQIRSELGKLPLVLKLILLVGVIGIGYNFVRQKTNQQSVTYQTASPVIEPLIVTVSASGSVTNTNSASITTESSGVIKSVLVNDGDLVLAGQKLAVIELDQIGKQKHAQALAAYQNAQNTLAAANSKYFSLQADLFTQWNSFKQLAENSTYTRSDDTPNLENRQLPEFVVAQNKWRSAEETYKQQQLAISQAQSNLTSVWHSYQQSSPDIVAPLSGKVNGLSLQVGSVINASNDTNTTRSKVANILTQAKPTILVNLNQLDTPTVKVGQKTTVTFDAYADKTFTGKVISVDTVGSVSSGVTSYPAVIVLDTEPEEILPNMSAQVAIIVATKATALQIPTTAITTQNSTATVQVIKNNQPQTVTVETGLSNDTMTEILSGLDKNDTVIIATVQPNTKTASPQSTSPFTPFGNRGFGAGGIRVAR